MPNNCKTVDLKDVVKFFVEEIDGMGKFDGYPRNEGVPDSLVLSREWQMCELTQDEFLHLNIPDGTNTLIKDKDDTKLDAIVESNVVQRMKILNRGGGDLPALIVRTKLLALDEPEESSYYIEDGAKRAITFKRYFKENPYKPVRAYIGKR